MTWHTRRVPDNRDCLLSDVALNPIQDENSVTIKSLGSFRAVIISRNPSENMTVSEENRRHRPNVHFGLYLEVIYFSAFGKFVMSVRCHSNLCDAHISELCEMSISRECIGVRLSDISSIAISDNNWSQWNDMTM